MPRTFHKIPPEVKATILKQVKLEWRKMADAAWEFDITVETIRSWLKKEVDEIGTKTVYIYRLKSKECVSKFMRDWSSCRFSSFLK